MELIVDDTWLGLGPDADEAVRQAVRQMQRHAFEVQPAAAAEFEPIAVELEPRQSTLLASPCRADMTRRTSGRIAAHLPALLADARQVELPWAGHLTSLERPFAVADVLVGFLYKKVPVG